MNKFFVAQNNKQEGPFLIDELLKMNIKKDTLVWKEGMTEWTKAEDVDELSKCFASQPPPLHTIQPPPLHGKQNTLLITEKENEHLNKNRVTSVYHKSNIFKYVFSTNGRIGRREYLFSWFIYFGCTQLASRYLPSDYTFLILPIFFFSFWLLLAQGSKRCQDLGKPLWYQLIPLYFFWLIVAPGDNWVNEYGANINGYRKKWFHR